MMQRTAIRSKERHLLKGEGLSLPRPTSKADLREKLEVCFAVANDFGRTAELYERQAVKAKGKELEAALTGALAFGYMANSFRDFGSRLFRRYYV
ncbi:MAG: hypothetical protein K0S20_608 [Patescibacteria group bacterium]|jgi:hypothetical protein|nr:hypothetical protein [Patescibacteria group bacterium]